MKFNVFRRLRNILIVGLLLAFLTAQGCVSRQGITIDSDPQGAEILADGKNIGKTPMSINQDDVFPPRWVGRSYRVKGQLELKKAGCEDIRMDVSDLVLSKDIKKTLKCKPEMTQSSTETKTLEAPKLVVTPALGEAKPVPKSSTGNNDIENRLARLKGFRDRGIISAKEYAEQRKRILDSL